MPSPLPRRRTEECGGKFSESRDRARDASRAGHIVGSRFHLRQCLSVCDGFRAYRATDFGDGHDVVVKMISAASMHPGALMRLEFEATLLARLQSPWLPRVLHVGHEGDDLLIVYSYVPGVPLRERLEVRPFSVAESLVVATAMFSALARCTRTNCCIAAWDPAT